MQFTPKTEKQLSEERMLPAGVYDFEVMKAENKISKSGNEMIKITLRVFAPDGSTLLVDDYLMEAMQFKLLHFCECAGLMSKYEAGTLEAFDCEGVAGKVNLKQDPAKDNFQAKNSVKDYVKPQGNQGAPKTRGEHFARSVEEPLGDPLPWEEEDIPL